jgi:hypothetical protein
VLHADVDAVGPGFRHLLPPSYVRSVPEWVPIEKTGCPCSSSSIILLIRFGILPPLWSCRVMFVWS